MGTDAEKLRRLNRELSILNVIAQALNQSVDLDQTIQTVLAHAADLLDLETGWVLLLREEDERVHYLAAAQNLPPILINQPHKMEVGCYCLNSFRDGDMAGAANVNVVECSRLSGMMGGTGGLRCHASVPLYAHGKKLGVLNVASTDWRQLSADELKLLYTIGDMLGIAIERGRLFAQSSQLGAVQERNRLAREIHDTLAQGLTAVTLQLESADALLEAGANGQKVRHTVQHALTLTRQNLEEARRSVMDLRATPLEGCTLRHALAELVQKCSVPTDFEVSGGNHPLPPRVELGIYRIAQEALHNVERHAQATLVQIILNIFPELVELIIEDNGRGFDLEKIPADRFGLVGMNERVKLLNGRLHIHTTPSGGTKIETVIPL